MNGKIIVIDGMDGVGKHTQCNLLIEKLKEQGKKVVSFSFPNYESDSSYFIKKYLGGEYKDINNPYITSLFYSIDRGITFAREIKSYYDQGYIIILDRYYLSNVLYQLHNLETYSDKMTYIQYLGIVEVEGCKLPIPDLSIILYALPEVSNRLINERYNNDDSKRDINENIHTQNLIFNNIAFLDKYKNLNSIKNTLGPIETFCIHNDIGQVHNKIHITKQLLDVINIILEEN